jgi:hypothetical protein
VVNIFFANFRIHRSIMSSTYNGMPQLASQFGDSQDNRSSGQALASQILSSKALHSWVYPQSTLPAAVISVLTLSATEGGCQKKTIIHINCFLLPSSFLFLTFLLLSVDIDFIRKRQLAWEDSFRSLYYMLRKNICNIFYGIFLHEFY